eukprot:PhM_4_TR10438/c1_g1_i4/m.78117
MMTDRRSAFTLLRVVLSIVLASVPVLVHAHDRFPTDFSALGATASFSGYTVDRYNTSYTTKTLGPHVPGEDARYSLSFKASFPPASVHATLGSFTKLEYLFNLTTGSTMAARVRIIPAYPSRAMSGTTPVDCASHTDYWAEFWGVQTLKVYSFTYSVRADATLTYTVPPFPYRFCIAPNLVGVNITSRDVDDRRVSAHVKTTRPRRTSPGWRCRTAPTSTPSRPLQRTCGNRRRQCTQATTPRSRSSRTAIATPSRCPARATCSPATCSSWCPRASRAHMSALRSPSSTAAATR